MYKIRPIVSSPVRATAAVCAAALAILALPGVAGATQIVDRFNLGKDALPQSHPASDHGVVVYQQRSKSTGWNIWGYDLATAHRFPICTASGDQVAPDISWPNVVWEDHRSGNADIYGADISAAPAEYAVCTEPHQQTAPSIDGTRVVWEDQRNGNHDIYGATVGVAGDVAICSRPNDQTAPDVSGDYAVWVDNRPGGPDIYGYSFSAHYEFPICTDVAAQSQPAVDGLTVVWSDARGGALTGSDIYGFSLLTGATFPVCTAKGTQNGPAISGDLVAWADGRSGVGMNVYARDLTLGQELALCTVKGWQGEPAVSGDTAVWADGRAPSLDLYGVKMTPWNAHIAIQYGAVWTDSAKVTVILSAQSKTGIVTQMSLANPGVVGVPEPYASRKWPWSLPAGDGVKHVSARFTDITGAGSPAVGDSITLDTHGPVTRVLDPVSAAQGQVVTIAYRVNDNLSPRASVVIRIKNSQGAVVKIIQPGWMRTGKALTRSFVCALAPATYRISVAATDYAGNTQAHTGFNKLTVTP